LFLQGALRKDTEKKHLDELTANWDFAGKRKTNAESNALSAQTLVNERTANEQKQLTAHDKAQLVYSASLRDNGFDGEAEFKAALLTENELAELNRKISDYEKNGFQLARDRQKQ